MPFYQNLFEEYRGQWVFTDSIKRVVLNFPVPANRNRGDVMIAFNVEPYDFSSVNTLTVNFSLDLAHRYYGTFGVNVAGATPAATTAAEVAAALNANAAFSDLFTASAERYTKDGVSVMIRFKRHERSSLRVYVSNSGAETKLGFNKYASVKEMPTFFDKHTIQDAEVHSDGDAWLLKLDVSDAVDQALITAAGLNYASPKADWQLLNGGTDTFKFRKRTLDGDGNILTEIAYPAGAGVGDMAVLTVYQTYVGTSATNVFQMPYVLGSGDLITPP